MMIDSKRLMELAKQKGPEFLMLLNLNMLQFLIEDAEHDQQMRNMETASKRRISAFKNQLKKKDSAWKRAWTLGWNAWEKHQKGEESLPKTMTGECREAWLKANAAARQYSLRGDAIQEA